MQLNNIYRLAYISGHPNLAEYIRIAIPSPELPTAATNGWDILYNPEFVSSLSVRDAVGVFMHEYYHIIYDHVARRKHRDLLIWNLAADVVVNEAVENRCGFSLPNNAIRRGKGMFKDLPDDIKTTTAIYDWIIQNAKEPSEQEKAEAEGHVSDEEIPQSTNNYMKQAGQLADKSDEIREVLAQNNDIEWIDLVKAMQIEAGRLVHRTHKRSYMRPARYEPDGIIRPCHRRYQHHPKVDVYIDVSGSMNDNPIQIFSGLKTILSAMRIYRPTFFTFNADIVKIDIKSDKFSIGGGTDIKKVLSKINNDKADLAILITDCEDAITNDDIKSNVIVVSNNITFADYYTTEWRKVKRND